MRFVVPRLPASRFYTDRCGRRTRSNFFFSAGLAFDRKSLLRGQMEARAMICARTRDTASPSGKKRLTLLCERMPVDSDSVIQVIQA